MKIVIVGKLLRIKPLRTLIKTLNNLIKNTRLSYVFPTYISPILIHTQELTTAICTFLLKYLLRNFHNDVPQGPVLGPLPVSL